MCDLELATQGIPRIREGATMECISDKPYDYVANYHLYGLTWAIPCDGNVECIGKGNDTQNKDGAPFNFQVLLMPSSGVHGNLPCRLVLEFTPPEGKYFAVCNWPQRHLYYYGAISLPYM